MFNHFYVIGPKSYRIRQNNEKYTAITPFKGHLKSPILVLSFDWEGKGMYGSFR